MNPPAIHPWEASPDADLSACLDLLVETEVEAKAGVGMLEEWNGGILG
jgi:hypothetical protein